jgi:hypothetical protein
MKKISYGLAFFVFLFGCASTQVIENHFISRNPDIYILVEPAFKYVGSTKHKWTGDTLGSVRPVFDEEESFIFVKEKSPEYAVKSILVLSIQKTGADRYQFNLFPDNPQYLENDIITLGSSNYQFVTQFGYPNMKSNLMGYLRDKGIIFPGCIVFKLYAQAVYLNTLMKIEYLEDQPTGRYQCTDWSNKIMLHDDQKEFIKAFSRRSNESFKIIPLKSQ